MGATLARPKQQGPYDGLTIDELRQVAASRGLRSDYDRVVLLACLDAHDIGSGAAQASDNEGPSSESDEPPETPDADLSFLREVKSLRDIPGTMGVDIGGTLAKLTLAIPRRLVDPALLPAAFKTHLPELTLTIPNAEGEMCVLHFLQAETSRLESTVRDLRSLGPFGQTQLVRILSGESLASTAAGQMNVRSCAQSVSPAVETPMKYVHAAGGGAHKFAELFRETLKVEFQKMAEMRSIVEGLHFLHSNAKHIPDGELYTVDQAGSRISKDWPSSKRLFPFIVVSMGSGVSILRVDGWGGRDKVQASLTSCTTGASTKFTTARPHPLAVGDVVVFGDVHQTGAALLLSRSDGHVVTDVFDCGFAVGVNTEGASISLGSRASASRPGDFSRIGGTACGGATFLGLTKLLCDAHSFEEAISMAQGGDCAKVDKLVSDIYGEDGSASLGLAGSLTASNFGKLAGASHLIEGAERPSSQDLARGVLQMVVQQSCLLALSFAAQIGCQERVFFCGGFLDGNTIGQRTIATTFGNLGFTPNFIRHADFLGSLGSLSQSSAFRMRPRCRSASRRISRGLNDTSRPCELSPRARPRNRSDSL
mmetsp:Transcript_75316/g.201181  ORF Transcript_75316/g.201181 Transcript_75316/m.201181 type:complete len:595 (+) Transcript_75316:83-1867(+)